MCVKGNFEKLGTIILKKKKKKETKKVAIQLYITPHRRLLECKLGSLFCLRSKYLKEKMALRTEQKAPIRSSVAMAPVLGR